MDPQSWSLNNAELLQQIGTLMWINDGDASTLKDITTARIGYELWSRFSGEKDIDALRNQTILTISKYVKDHPKASKEELTKEVAKQISAFAQKVENL